MYARGIEIELKLLLDQTGGAAFDECPFISAHRRGRSTTRRLDATYYDTADRALRKADLTLRVRRSGRRFMQTLKSASDDGHPLKRREWESPVPSLVPDTAALAEMLPEDLRTILKAGPLEPVFTTTIRRRQCLIEVADADIELAIDEGSIQSNGRMGKINELELELKRGPSAALYETALQLFDHHPFTLGVESKSARGYALALDLPPRAAKAPTMVLDPDMALGAAFERILRAGQSHILTNLAAAADGRDVEGVHQMRVGLRRLRSALSLLRAVAPSPTLESLREDAKWIASALGDARGWDVFLVETLPEVTAGCPGALGFDSLRAAAECLRAKAYSLVRETIAASRNVRFHLTLGAFIERRGWQANGGDGRFSALAEDTATFAVRMLADRHRKVLERGRHFRHLPPEARHELRIALKKLRYSADFFLPAIGHRRAAKRYLRRLGGFQDQLGRLNDMAVTGNFIDQLQELDGDARLAAGVVVGWQARGLVEAEPAVRAAWHAFRDTETPWPRHPSDSDEADDGST